MSLSEEQKKIEEFMQRYDMRGTPEFQIIDLMAEVGEVAGDVTKSSEYGLEKNKMDVKKDELGDVFFSLFAVCSSLGIDSEEALETALEKYEDRIIEKGDPGSK
ncbi:MAG: MazG nucleotide pyrophosphohydrolase domain-containing protein [Candidatus Nanohalobium sp.]